MVPFPCDSSDSCLGNFFWVWLRVTPKSKNQEGRQAFCPESGQDALDLSLLIMGKNQAVLNFTIDQRLGNLAAKCTKSRILHNSCSYLGLCALHGWCWRHMSLNPHFSKIFRSFSKHFKDSHCLVIFLYISYPITTSGVKGDEKLCFICHSLI